MIILRVKSMLCIGFAFLGMALAVRADVVAGPLFSDFSLTLEPGRRTEAMGPFFYSQETQAGHLFAVPPLFSVLKDPSLELTESAVLYPVFSYVRYGGEYRVQLAQLISWAGGRSQEDDTTRRFTIFPLYFHQRNTNDPSKNYTAVVPFYGNLKNRLFRDEIHFVMFPVYSQTRKKDVVTDNYLYPIFHNRHGDHVRGWQVWPFVGRESGEMTYQTNLWTEEVTTNGASKSLFVMWPIYFRTSTGLGTTHPAEMRTVVPFYSSWHSPSRDSVSYGWPFGYTLTEDREKNYRERDIFWPLIVHAKGENKYTSRIFPFYSHATNSSLESHWWMWPLVKVNRLHGDLLERSRTRILFFLYSDTLEKITPTGESKRRVDFFPFFTRRREMDGRERLQILSIIEPILPNSKYVVRNYAPLYTFWLAEKNPKTGAKSQSLLWNLYRNEQTPETKKCSILFGLFQYESSPEGKSWRVCYVPVKRGAGGGNPARDGIISQ